MKQAFLDLLKHRVVESVHHHSGGNFFHRFLRFDNGIILAIHFATQQMEVSWDDHESIQEYIDIDFGVEYELPNYDKRVMDFDAFFIGLFNA